MTTYKIYQTSHSLRFFAITVSIIFILLSTYGANKLCWAYLERFETWHVVLSFVPLTIPLIFITRKFIRAMSVVPVALSFDDISLQHVWTKSFLLYECEDIEIEWTTVNYFEFYNLKDNYSLFELKLNNGSHYTLLHNDEDKDDFNLFKEAILKLEKKKSAEEIQKENYYLTINTLVLTFLVTLTGIAIIIWTLYHPASHKSNLNNYISGGGLMVGALLFNIKPVARFLNKLFFK